MMAHHDMICWCLETRRWALQEVRGEGPKPIYLHTSAIYDGRMVCCCYYYHSVSYIPYHMYDE
jgi:hypothetical protein